jgi:hypothetical protein
MFLRMKKIIHNIDNKFVKKFTSGVNKNKYLTCEKYGCSNCSNCNKIFDCNKFFYGLIIGNSIGFYFGYSHCKKLYS